MVLRQSAFERDHAVRTLGEDHQIRACLEFVATHDPRSEAGRRSGTFHSIHFFTMAIDGKGEKRLNLRYWRPFSVSGSGYRPVPRGGVRDLVNLARGRRVCRLRFAPSEVMWNAADSNLLKLIGGDSCRFD